MKFSTNLLFHKMKSVKHIIQVFLLIIIYCFGIYNSANIIPFSNDNKLEQNHGNKEYLIASAKILSPHSQQSEVSISGVTEYPTPDFKLSFSVLPIISKSSELLLNSIFKQYRCYFKNLLIRNRKSDLIFPFHNFW